MNDDIVEQVKAALKTYYEDKKRFGPAYAKTYIANSIIPLLPKVLEEIEGLRATVGRGNQNE